VLLPRQRAHERGQRFQRRAVVKLLQHFLLLRAGAASNT
jgi:hypothetical protein